MDLAHRAGVTFGRGTFVERPSPVFGAPSDDKLAVFDWQDDGDLDIYFNNLRIQRNDGTGTFTGDTLADVTPDGLPFTLARGIGDYTGDGRADFLVPVATHMGILGDDGLGGFVELGPASPDGEKVQDAYGLVEQADLDLDGDLDLLTTFGYWANDGAGFFTPTTGLYAGDPMDAGDVDADGDVDVLTAFNGFDTVRLQRNAGGLVFTPETLYTGAFASTESRLRDLEGDGDLDALLGASQGVLRWLENTTGGFVLAEEPLFAGDFHFTTCCVDDLRWMDVFDVDGDGLGDLVASGELVAVLRRTDPSAATYAPVRLHVSTAARFGDVDGDGDVDGLGTQITRNLMLDAPAAGVIQQYGEGTPGTAGAVPVLGCQGPAAAGTSGAVRIRGGLGGATAFLFLGASQAAVTDFPFPGATVHLGDQLLVLPLALGGAAGVAGAGGIDLPIALPAAVLPGLTFYHQAVVIDAGAPFGAALSNGLRITYGL
jgi:hypothetical protein